MAVCGGVCVRVRACACVCVRACTSIPGPGLRGELFFPGLTGGSQQSFGYESEEMMWTEKCGYLCLYLGPGVVRVPPRPVGAFSGGCHDPQGREGLWGPLRLEP